jgi:hypothetical protein
MVKIPFPRALLTEDWIRRCARKIAEMDSSLAPHDVQELATALAGRASCRALEPERAIELLLDNRRGASQWLELDD